MPNTFCRLHQASNTGRCTATSVRAGDTHVSLRYTQRGVADGLKEGMPLALSVLPWGVAYGVAAQGIVPTAQALVISAYVYSATAQFVALDMWRHPFTIPRCCLRCSRSMRATCYKVSRSHPRRAGIRWPGPFLQQRPPPQRGSQNAAATVVRRGILASCLPDAVANRRAAMMSAAIDAEVRLALLM
jgi:hypothetical protein